VILIKVWRCGGGVSVPRPLGSPHKANASFIIFLISLSSMLVHFEACLGLAVGSKAPYLYLW
jgi:hypothetical protein